MDEMVEPLELLQLCLRNSHLESLLVHLPVYTSLLLLHFKLIKVQIFHILLHSHALLVLTLCVYHVSKNGDVKLLRLACVNLFIKRAEINTWPRLWLRLVLNEGELGTRLLQGWRDQVLVLDS